MSGVLVRRTILFEPGSRRCTGGVAIIGPVVIFLSFHSPPMPGPDREAVCYHWRYSVSSISHRH